MTNTPTPNASYSLTVRVKIHNRPGKLGQITTAIGHAGPVTGANQCFADEDGHFRARYGVPAPVITMSLFERFRSRQGNSFQDRVLAALRNQFGGHAVKKREA